MSSHVAKATAKKRRQQDNIARQEALLALGAFFFLLALVLIYPQLTKNRAKDSPQGRRSPYKTIANRE